MYDHYIDLAKNIFDSQNIQTIILTSPFDNISQIDYSLRSHLYPQQNPYEDLLRTAARECEVHPFYIDKISRQFAIEIEQCTNDLQLTKLSTDMIRKYCLLIHNHSVKKYSDNIQDCVTYIDLHYNENLTLKKMAEYLNLNSSYLSTLFKKELGKTVTEYVTQTRIKQALLLLNSTKQSIRDVANQCGFDDINYFSRIFKKYQGMSPSSYRKMIQDI